jgi:hypothetical protein
VRKRSFIPLKRETPSQHTHLLSLEKSSHERLKLVVTARAHDSNVIQPQILVWSLDQVCFYHKSHVAFTFLDPFLQRERDV